MDPFGPAQRSSTGRRIDSALDLAPGHQDKNSADLSDLLTNPANTMFPLLTTMRAIHCFFVLASCLGGFSSAATMIQPTSVSSATPVFGTYQLNNLINQDGLSQTYVSGVTDHATYLASVATQASNPLTQYAVMSDAANATYDFDLGSSHHVTHLLLWNGPSSATTRVATFSVSISDSPTFGTSQSMGSFSSSPSAAHPVAVENFALTAANGRYVRIITTNAGGARTLIGEVAFAGNAVPEPSTALLGAFGLFGLLRRRR